MDQALRRGLLIAFEGIDGTGKTTQVARAMAYLQGRLGPDAVVYSKEPGSTKLGLALREIIFKEVTTKEMSVGVVDLLFLASHMQNWDRVIKPALISGKTVVSDRYWYSQMAYMTQRQVPPSIAVAYTECCGDPADLLIFLYGSAPNILDRARKRTTETHQADKVWNDAKVLELIQEEYWQEFSEVDEWSPVCVDGKDEDAVWEEVKVLIDSAIASAR